MPVQWVHLPDGSTLVASVTHAWIQRPEFGALGLRGPMTDSVPPRLDTTRNLLDGAIAAAERAAPPVHEPPLTATRWAWELVGQWYCAHHSVALLPGLIDRFESSGRSELAEFTRRKLDEEHGHDQFPLDDLRALGYDAEALVRDIPPPPSAEAEVRYARASVSGEHPIGFLGYVYALERRIIRVTDAWLASLQSILPAGVDATSALRLHASELDIDHVEDAIRFVSGLPADDRTRIATSCYRTTEISCASYRGQATGDAILRRRLARHLRRPDPLSARHPQTKEAGLGDR